MAFYRSPNCWSGKVRPKGFDGGGGGGPLRALLAPNSVTDGALAAM